VFKNQYNRHSRRLHSQGKFLGLVKCPHCDVRGGLWESYEPGVTGWTRYCYFCSHAETVERTVDREARERTSLAQVRANEARIAELEQYLASSGIEENNTMRSWKLQVQLEKDGPWTETQPRFSTMEQADSYGSHTALQSDLVFDYRAVGTLDEPTHYYDKELQAPVPIEMQSCDPAESANEMLAGQQENFSALGETWPDGEGRTADDIIAAEQQQEDDEEELDEEIMGESIPENLEETLVAQAAIAEELADIAEVKALQAEADAEDAEDAAVQAEEALDALDTPGDIPEACEVIEINPYLIPISEFLAIQDYTGEDPATEYLGDCLDGDEPGETLALCREGCLVDPAAYCVHNCPAAVTMIVMANTGKTFEEAAEMVRTTEETLGLVEEPTVVVEVA